MKRTRRQPRSDRAIYLIRGGISLHIQGFSTAFPLFRLFIRAPHRWSTLNRDRRRCFLTVSGMKRALSEITFYWRKDEGGKRWKKKHQRQNSVAAVMAAARTVIAFPRVSYYPRSTTPFIHGDDASRVVVCVVVYRPLRGPFFFNTGDRSATSSLSLLRLRSTSNGRGNSHRNTTGSVSHWSMAMGVRRLEHHGLLARDTRVLDQVCRSLVQLQVYAGRDPGAASYRSQARASPRRPREMRLPWLITTLLALGRLSRCEARPTFATRGRAIPRCILICYLAAWAHLYSLPANLRRARCAW